MTDGIELTETGIVVADGWTRELWESAGNEIGRFQKGLMWLIGDWLNAGSREGYVERGRTAEACERFGIAYDTALQATRVAAAFESCTRVQELGWKHHQVVANHPQASELLEWASEEGATTRQLAAEKKRLANGVVSGTNESRGQKGDAEWEFKVGDCRSLPFADDSFDLVFCSPPYESQREYGEVGFGLSGEAWVEWAVECYMECLRVSRGLVAWVVEGCTKDFAYSSSPFLLHADLHRRGVKMRKTVVYNRNGIPGTGGPDWLRNDWEPIICGTKAGRLPWSENTAMGSPPKQNKARAATNRNKDGTRKRGVYVDPAVCNPGNIVSGLVGCGGMGWRDASENEAPFPEWLAEFFVRSFCPPGGCVLDPFSGSGTTVSVAVKNGRNATGLDVRESQIWLGETRLMGLTVKDRKGGQGALL